MANDNGTLYVSLEPSDPTDPNSDCFARLRTSREEAEYHSPYVLSFADYMALPDAPTLVI